MFILGRQYRDLFETIVSMRVAAALATPTIHASNKLTNDIQVRNSISGFGNKKTGFTLIELLITIAIVAVLVTLAEPSYSTFIEKRKITGGAEEIASFMMLARSEAVKHNQQTTVSFFRDPDTNDWCIGMMLGSEPCDCKISTDTDAKYCALKYTDNVGPVVEPQLISSSDYSGFKLTAATTAFGGDQALTYDPVRGILAEPTDLSSFTVQSNNAAYELRVNISATGTVKTCTNSSKKVWGYKSCP
jgi:type IV fimbrial biogenesis protein FimT